ncbi:hypothetical protein GCM10023220_16470 [Streptomyces ziwulingensis]|uniref:Uncharacterized protein n=1 Tax=Streptomyces ziwulingensis TaxID=1045501 RepID=A0ABP9B7R1_9ACTN
MAGTAGAVGTVWAVGCRDRRTAALAGTAGLAASTDRGLGLASGPSGETRELRPVR